MAESFFSASYRSLSLVVEGCRALCGLSAFREPHFRLSTSAARFRERIQKCPTTGRSQELTLMRLISHGGSCACPGDRTEGRTTVRLRAHEGSSDLTVGQSDATGWTNHLHPSSLCPHPFLWRVVVVWGRS